MALISALVGILPRKLTKAVVTAWAGARVWRSDASERSVTCCCIVADSLLPVAGSVDEHAMSTALVRICSDTTALK